ncbi:MAG: hypothetical protein JETT_0743 [Candidatus Jettenia ecosi]|uniref:Uncharacterized protein n=1 Tax=Candidatus Jettenia ecosi TaxID=2494326 RepID=A0A533QDY3_9BACT|nr:MAG: hypothetical protein JETT_0743 [Candidatus Jettenia ecosi]
MPPFLKSSGQNEQYLKLQKIIERMKMERESGCFLNGFEIWNSNIPAPPYRIGPQQTQRPM